MNEKLSELNAQIYNARLRWFTEVRNILDKAIQFADSISNTIGDISVNEADIAVIKFVAEKLGERAENQKQ